MDGPGERNVDAGGMSMGVDARGGCSMWMHVGAACHMRNVECRCMSHVECGQKQNVLECGQRNDRGMWNVDACDMWNVSYACGLLHVECMWNVRVCGV